MLDETTAPEIWKRANDQLQKGDLTSQGILKKFDVKALCTTDDPTDSLEFHDRIHASSLPTRVFPAFRPDAAFNTADPHAFNQWVDRLAGRTGVDINDFTRFVDASRRATTISTSVAAVSPITALRRALRNLRAAPSPPKYFAKSATDKR